ncbi:MAG: hypothetical protein MAG453_02158 [Calditrichaeota bacterium]|nr:hypothetical protein [Calditrichota bacterium]
MTQPPLATTLHTTIGLGWTILGALVLVALAVWSYRWTRPPVRPWARAALAVLRALALVAVWLLAVGFEVRWEREEPVRPLVTILLDASESMSFHDPSGSREDTARAIAGDGIWDVVREHADLERLTFSQALQPWRPRGVPELDGPVTNVETAFNQLASRPGGAPDALVLISDGAFNRGGSYTSAATRLGVPVYSVAVGDSLPSRDLVVSSVVAPELAYSGDPFPLDVTVRATGAPGETVTVRVVGDGGRVLGARELTVEGMWSEQTARFELTPERAGINSWTVEVAPEQAGAGESSPPEADTTNNTRRAVVRAAERRRSVLLVSPAPNPDAAAVARALEHDPDTDPVVVIGAGQMNRAVRGSWDEIDLPAIDAAFVFLAGPVSSNSIETIRRVANSDVPAAWFAGGEQIAPALLEAARARLGNPRVWMEPAEAILRPVAAHPLFNEQGGFFASGPTPPVMRGPYRPSEGDVLAVVSANGEDVPTIIASSRNPRTLAWFASGLARWDRVRRVEDPGGEGFHALLDRTLRWLTGGGEQDRIAVRPEQQLFAGGEEARLQATVRDAALNPVEDARVTARVTRRAAGGGGDGEAPGDGETSDGGQKGAPAGEDRDGGRARTVEFQSLGGGRYLARFVPWGEGRYHVEATVETDEETVTRTSEFVVDRFELEAAERRMRPDRLRAIADATGGHVIFSTVALDTLASLLPRGGEWVDVRGTWRPFGLWLTLLLVTAALAAEWLARTRTGMA